MLPRVELVAQSVTAFAVPVPGPLPPEQPAVVAPPFESVQRVAAVPLTVPAVRIFVSVPCSPVSAVPPLTDKLVFAVIVVPVMAAGVVPPIAPGLGKETVEPPRATAVPAILIEE